MERQFIKSRHSSIDYCVEASSPDSLEFRKPWSGGNGGNCVEVADNLADCVAVRDSKLVEAEGPLMHVGPEAFTAFVGGLAIEEFAHVA